MAKNSQANVQSRRRKIVRLTLNAGEIRINELSRLLGVSSMTIRRDLEDLEQHQIIQKTSVGAVRLRDSFEIDPGYTKRHLIMKSEKLAIAEQAIRLIPNGATLGLDASSTTLELAKRLFDLKNIRIATNSLLIPPLLAQHSSLRLTVAGGTMRAKAISVVGSEACGILSRYNYDYVFFSTNAIDPEQGLTDTSEAEIETKLALLKNAAVKVLLADSGKLGKRAYRKCCGVEDVDMVITDWGISEEMLEAFTSRNVKVIVAQREDGSA